MDPLIMFVFRIFWRFQKLIILTIYFPKRSWGLWACTFLGSRIVKYQLFSKILMLKRDFQWKELTPGRAASFKWSHISWKETSSSSVKQFPAPSKVKWICEMSNSFLLLDPFLCEGTLLIKGSTKTGCFQRFTSKRRVQPLDPRTYWRAAVRVQCFHFFLGPVLNLFLSVDPRFQKGGGRLGGVVRIHSEACWGDVEEDVLRAFMTSAGSKTIFRRQTHGCTGCAAGSAIGFLFDGFVWLPVWRCVWVKSEECHGRKLARGGQEWHHVTPEPDYQSRTIIGRRVGPAEPRGGKYFPTVREVHGFGMIWHCIFFLGCLNHLNLSNIKHLEVLK